MRGDFFCEVAVGVAGDDADLVIERFVQIHEACVLEGGQGAVGIAENLGLRVFIWNLSAFFSLADGHNTDMLRGGGAESLMCGEARVMEVANGRSG